MRTVRMAPRLARRGVAPSPRRGRMTLYWRRLRAPVLAAAVTPVTVAAPPSALAPAIHHLRQTFDLRRRYLVQAAAQRMMAPGARLAGASVRWQPAASATPRAVVAARLWRAPVPARRVAARATTVSPVTLRSHTMAVHRLALAGPAGSTPGTPRTVPGAPHAPFAAAPNERRPRAALTLTAAAIRMVGQRVVGAPMRAHRTSSTPLHRPRTPAPPTFALGPHPARMPLARPTAPLPASRPDAVTRLAPLALAWARPAGAGAGAPAIAVAGTPAKASSHTTATPAQMATGPSEHVVTNAREATRHEVNTALHSPANLERLAAEVMVRIDKRLRIERERRGL